MNPDEAFKYIDQALGDYLKTLPPSAAGPTQQMCLQALQILKPKPPEPPAQES